MNAEVPLPHTLSYIKQLLSREVLLEPRKQFLNVWKNVWNAILGPQIDDAGRSAARYVHPRSMS